MGLTYFKRFRMELDLERPLFAAPPCPAAYQLLPFDERLIRDHALAKFLSFRQELDVNVFPCLGRRDGCLQLMREIAKRSGFVPEATWLLQYTDPQSGNQESVGTVQGLQFEGWGAIQNLGICPRHRGGGLGTLLLCMAARGFRSIGLARMHLEVTTDNTAALRLYERLGFRRAKVVYKAAEVAMA
jgi:ribosomal protein S18 acetylase RimI-like enzyme